MPVVDYQRSQNKVVDVDAMKPVDEVYQDICNAIDTKFKHIRNS